MIVSVEKPKITKFKIRMERGDELYRQCIWADIILDHDSYSISAQTDCGNYAYRWSKTPDESFANLCLRMLRHEEYLLNKFSDRTEFDLEGSRDLVLIYYDEPEIMDQIKNIYANDAHEWIELLGEIEEVSEPYEYVVMDYPHAAKIFVSILANVVYPELMKLERQKT